MVASAKYAHVGRTYLDADPVAETALALLYEIRRGVDQAIHRLRLDGPHTAGSVSTRLDALLDTFAEAHGEVLDLASEQAREAAA